MPSLISNSGFYLPNYKLLQPSDFPDTTGLYVWPLNGVSSFSGTGSYGGVDLTQIGSVSTGLNHLGNTVYNTLNGSSSATYANDSSFTDTGSFTMGGWFKQNGTSGSQNLMSNGSSFYVYTSSSILYFDLYYSAGSRIVASMPSNFLSDGLYHHVIVVYNQASLSLFIYVDGQMTAYNSSGSLNVRYNSGGSNKLSFGSYWNGSLNNPFNGNICDCFYKKTAMSLSQCRKIYVVGTKLLANLDQNSKVKINGEQINFELDYDVASLISSTIGSVSGQSGRVTPYKTSTGKWKIKGYLYTNITSAGIWGNGNGIYLSGVTFANTDPYEGQALAGGAFTANGVMAIVFFANPGGNIIYTYFNGNGSAGSNSFYLSLDVFLNSKPTWALDTYSLY